MCDWNLGGNPGHIYVFGYFIFLRVLDILGNRNRIYLWMRFTATAFEGDFCEKPNEMG